MSSREAKFTSYSDFIGSGIDPTKEIQAAQLRSGLIYPNQGRFDGDFHFIDAGPVQRLHYFLDLVQTVR